MDDVAAYLTRVALEKERRLRRRRKLPLLDIVPAASSPTEPFEAPRHLGPMVELLEASDTSPVRALFSVPPRHSKTETILHSIAWMLLRKPHLKIAYLSYGFTIAREKSIRARAIAARIGVPLDDRHAAAGNWKTAAGGGLFASGLGGPLTGFGFDRLFIDDPHKNRAEAEAPLLRGKVYDWFTGTAINRVEPGGSAYICHTRWHPDDLIGRLQKRRRKHSDSGDLLFRNVSLPAINYFVNAETGELADPRRADGEALWPSRWTVELLNERREEVDEYDWYSLFQCSPRTRGKSVFRGSYFFQGIPRGMRFAIGVDLAYSEGKRADYSVAVVLGYFEGTYYVLAVLRERCEAPEFAGKLRSLQKTYRGAKARWYASGTEKGNAQFLRSLGVKISALPAVTDKFVRAQPVAAAWNRGAILLPQTTDALLPAYLRLEAKTAKEESEDGEGGLLDRSGDVPDWVNTTVSELTSFTGVSDANDDIVDAIGAAYDELATTGGTSSGDTLETYESPMNGW